MKVPTMLALAGFALTTASVLAGPGPGPGDLERGNSVMFYFHFDTNRDGTLSSAELTGASQALAPELQARVFARYDTNKDADLQSFLATYDANKDGQVTRAEVLAVLQTTTGSNPGLGEGIGFGPHRH